jgi:3-deoxy-D-manno-octulosonate 8-phosphate phosphatase (KDO 8-P phosphatase)
MIRAIAMDVDGVLTDGCVSIDETGNQSKRVSFADIMGVSLGRRAGLQFALISGEGGPLLDQIAAKFSITDVWGGCKDKASALREFCTVSGLKPEEVCFIGDDVNDVAALKLSGLGVAPAGAHPSALDAASFVTSHSGGNGAVRETVDKVLY